MAQENTSKPSQFVLRAVTYLTGSTKAKFLADCQAKGKRAQVLRQIIEEHYRGRPMPGSRY